MRFVDVTNDIAFKKIFGNENKKTSLISFLNAVIKLPNNNVVSSVEIMNPYQLPNLYGGKSTIIDIKAIDQNGNSFLVEMQVAESSDFHKRILYYLSQSYTAQIAKGNDYKILKPVYFIGILEFEISKNKNFISCHKVVDVETNEHIFQDIEFNLIELPKFNKELKDLKTNIDQWVYFIKNAENINLIPDSVHDEGLKLAYHEAEKHNWTQRELDDYLRASIYEGDIVNREALVEKRAMERGMEKGMEKGMEMGMEKGIEKGMEKGIEKGKLIIAKNLLEKGITLEIITAATGLTKEQIKNLQ